MRIACFLLLMTCTAFQLCFTGRRTTHAASATQIDWQQIRGVNFFTSNASNAHEMWRRFDERVADRELGWARGLGFNSVRVWLSAKAYFEGSSRFSTNVSRLLDLCQKHQLTAMLVLFDCCGIEDRLDAVPMTIRQAYGRFLSDARFSQAEKDLIRSRYQQFADGRGKDMVVPVAKDTPFDILFWQNWSPNPGLSQMNANEWPRLEGYVDAVFRLGTRHSQVIAFDIMNEPGCLFDFPPGMSRSAAEAKVNQFLHHFGSYIGKRYPEAIRTIGSQSVDTMKAFAGQQTLLSFHTYDLGEELRAVLAEGLAFARGQAKPVLLTECLANTDNWLKIHGDERFSTDEAQLRHYRETLPLILKSGMGWYSWGFIAGPMFTPFTDILYPNGYRRPAALYLEDQLRSHSSE